MANNQNVNKVVYGGNTIVDLTGDTVTAADVLNGKTFHLASGAPATGTADISGKMDKVSNPTANDILLTDGNGQAVDSGVKLADLQNFTITENTEFNISGVTFKIVLDS